MRPTLKSTAIATLIGGCAAAGLAVASASTPPDRSEHGRGAVSSASASATSPEHPASSEAVHSGRGRADNAPTTLPRTHAATRTEHPDPEPGDDNGGATEPGDDRGGATDPGDDRGGATEPGDDNGGGTEPGDDNGGGTEPGDDRGGNEPGDDRGGNEPGDDRGGSDNRGPGGDDNSGPDRGSDD